MILTPFIMPGLIHGNSMFDQNLETSNGGSALRHSQFRHLTEDDLCPWCEKEEETWRHAFVDCQRVQGLWSKLDCSKLRKYDKMDSAYNLVESRGDVQNEKKILGIYLMWGIWLD